MHVEDYRGQISISTWNSAFYQVLLESKMFEGTLTMNIHEAPELLQKLHQGATLVDAIGVLQNFWELEEAWYAKGNSKPFHDAHGLRFVGKVNIWESNKFQRLASPEVYPGTELIPERLYIKDVASVQVKTHLEYGGKGGDFLARGISVSLRADMLQLQKEKLLNFLATPQRVTKVIDYFKPYYG